MKTLIVLLLTFMSQFTDSYDNLQNSLVGETNGGIQGSQVQLVSGNTKIIGVALNSIPPGKAFAFMDGNRWIITGANTARPNLGRNTRIRRVRPQTESENNIFYNIIFVAESTVAGDAFFGNIYPAEGQGRFYLITNNNKIFPFHDTAFTISPPTNLAFPFARNNANNIGDKFTVETVLLYNVYDENTVTITIRILEFETTGFGSGGLPTSAVLSDYELLTYLYKNGEFTGYRRRPTVTDSGGNTGDPTVANYNTITEFNPNTPPELIEFSRGLLAPYSGDPKSYSSIFEPNGWYEKPEIDRLELSKINRANWSKNKETLITPSIPNDQLNANGEYALVDDEGQIVALRKPEDMFLDYIDGALGGFTWNGRDAFEDEITSTIELTKFTNKKFTRVFRTPVNDTPIGVNYQFDALRHDATNITDLNFNFDIQYILGQPLLGWVGFLRMGDPTEGWSTGHVITQVNSLNPKGIH